MLGKLLADSGGADSVIDKLLSRTPKAALPWAMTLVAVIIGLPMFFEIGLVLLLPVIVLIAQRSGHRLMRIAIPALAGLSVLHGLVPPHPGPLIAINALNANLGTTLAFGLLVAIPTVVICGPVLAVLITRCVPVDAPAVAGGVDTRARSGGEAKVSTPWRDEPWHAGGWLVGEHPDSGVGSAGTGAGGGGTPAELPRVPADDHLPGRSDAAQGPRRHHLDRARTHPRRDASWTSSASRSSP